MTATTITLNGRKVTADIAPRTHLADFIREVAGLTGTHLGCEHGICGACTVEIDGEIARSCIAFAAACDGAIIRTIEGFDDDPLMARLRAAFREEHALQCGYCTPGMLIAARDLVCRGAARTEKEIRVAMSGNLCRCTGYAGIVAAIMRVLQDLAQEGPIALGAEQAFGLGPVGAHAKIAEAKPQPRAPSKREAAAPPAPRGSRRRPISVATSAPQEAGGMTTLRQSFVLPQPRELVWASMRDLERLAGCLPGAILDEPPAADGGFGGAMKVVFGPVSPTFRGRGIFMVSDADFSGHLRGSGQDGGGRSNATGEMRFHLTALETGTLVEAELSYKLAGVLAQFGRPGIVRGIVAGIGSVFATNLDRALAGEGQAAAQAELGRASLIGAIAKAWLATLIRQLSAVLSKIVRR